MANDVYQLQLLWDMAGEFAENVIHLEANRANSITPDVDAGEATQGFIANVQALLLDAVPDTVTLLGYKCKRINNGGGPTITNPATAAIGTRTGDLLPSNVAPCLSVPISTGTRFVNAKFFLPGAINSDLVKNVIQAGLEAAMIAFMESLQSGFTEGGITFAYGIFRRALAVFLPAIFTPNVAQVIGSQRRRRLPVM